MGDLRSSVFSKVSSNEVPFNYQFGALLGYSLETGPDLVTVVHPAFTLDEGTQLVALQDYSELDDSLEGGTCEIDIAFSDQNTIVGIESKRGSPLTTGQLQRELQVLEQNAAGREVTLLAVTEDLTPPNAVERAAESTEHTVCWDSWHRIALRFEEESLDDGYEPIRQMVIDLFDDSGYTLDFEGFPEPALESAVYLEWLQQFTNLMYDLETVLHSGPLYLNRSNGQSMPSFASKNTSRLENTYYQPAAVALFVPFTPDPTDSINNYGQNSHVSLYGNYHDDEVGVFLDLNPKNDEWVQEVLKEYKDEFTDTVLDEDMFFRVSRNSHCHYDFLPRDLRTRAEIIDFIENKAGTSEGKRVLIGRFLSEAETPRGTVESFANEIQFVYDRFFENEQILGQYRAD